MLWRIETSLRPDVEDVIGRRVAAGVVKTLGLPVDSARTVKVFTVSGLEREEMDRAIAGAALHDPVSHRASLEPLAKAEEFDWVIEVGYRPGVTDNEGRTAKETLAMCLGLPADRAKALRVYTSAQYLLRGPLSRGDVERLGRDMLANELIQRFRIKSSEEWRAAPGFEPQAAQVSGRSSDEVEIVDLDLSDEELTRLSREKVLALSLTEMKAIQAYYADPAVRAERAKLGLPDKPTDAELEALAQTWSEHCKHKIFTARIDYANAETGRREIVDSLFKTCIQGSTKVIRENLGDKDFCLSVFKDNAGVIKFDDDWSVCIKVETHNSPSALDPYGGALTGIVGVNRDPMGTGLGANLLCNTDVFCFASPFHDEPLPPRLLHPRRVMEGVREGVEHGGNKSGVPTVNGAIVFDERYLGKPLVYCGTVGILPAKIHGKPSHEKRALPGDAIIMAGGRIGKDGIHGATFSSEELHEGSPATAVQIGDPITQRKTYDFLMRARDAGLYNAITDNGAGGLSSSVGEMAQDSGGCELDLSKAPLKYDGLRPWEILLSEAQERMTLAVPPAKLEPFLELAREMDVEVTELGRFTDSGFFHVRYGDKPVACLRMEFLHEGTPQMELEAVWERPQVEPRPAKADDAEHGALLKRMLGRLNICSKEYAIRQYDHEVQGGSAIKPLVGVLADGPADAAVIRPVLGSDRGLVVSCGICPKFSDFDTYWMMANAIDEAVRNAVAVGADPDQLAGVDNFCWCDPVQSEKTPDGRYKLAQLVRANKALAHFCQAYGVPCVSGKDSMKNDYAGGGVKISIPPTVLYTVMGIVPDVTKAVTSDFKREGELIYVLGLTRNELGGSELADELKASYAEAPQVDAQANRLRYLALHRAVMAGLVTACHDCSDGGLAAALAEMAIGGRLGATVDLEAVPAETGLDDLALLYSESAGRLVVTVRPENQAAFEACFAPGEAGRVGRVAGQALSLRRGAKTLLDEPVEELAQAFKATLAW